MFVYLFCTEQQSSLHFAVDDSSFFLVRDNIGDIKLDNNRMYCHQAQTKLGAY